MQTQNPQILPRQAVKSHSCILTLYNVSQQKAAPETFAAGSDYIDSTTTIGEVGKVLMGCQLTFNDGYHQPLLLRPT